LQITGQQLNILKMVDILRGRIKWDHKTWWDVKKVLVFLEETLLLVPYGA
jgi:hypothetical protein